MRSPLKRKQLLLLPVLALTAIAGIAATSPEAYNPRVEAEEWAESNRAVLPTKLADVTTLPPLYRKAVARRLSPDLRSALWREHLETFLMAPELRAPFQQRMVSDVGGELNEAQRRLVQIAIDSFPSMFDTTRALHLRLRTGLRVCNKKRTEFNPLQGNRIFATLGPRDTVPELPAKFRTSAYHSGKSLQIAGVVQPVVHIVSVAVKKLTGAKDNNDCYCNRGSWCDCESGNTCADPTDCIIPIAPLNCGCGDIFPCNGRC